MIRLFRKQPWLWVQGDIYRAKLDRDPYRANMIRVLGGVEDMTISNNVSQKTSSLKRSELRAHQEYDDEKEDESVRSTWPSFYTVLVFFY